VGWLRGQYNVARQVARGAGDSLTGAEFIVPDWGDKVNSGIGLSYRPARLNRLMARYNNHMSELTMYPPVWNYEFGLCVKISRGKIVVVWMSAASLRKTRSHHCIVASPSYILYSTVFGLDNRERRHLVHPSTTA
jgi:hypothetical protein